MEQQHHNPQIPAPYDSQQAQLASMMMHLSQNTTGPPFSQPSYGGTPNGWSPHIHPQNTFMAMPGMFMSAEAMAQMAQMQHAAMAVHVQGPAPIGRGMQSNGTNPGVNHILKINIGSREDLEIVVKALHSGLADGKTHRQVLEELQGVHGHDAAAWKDYYLEQRDVIDENVRQRDAAPETKSASRAVSSSSSTSLARPMDYPEPARSAPSISSHSRVTSSSSKRQTQRARTSVIAKEVPPGAPKPPTVTVSKNGGQFAYTDEDKEFFVQTIDYLRKHKPGTTVADAVEYLAEHAPHHSADSWSWHWKRSRNALPRHLRTDNYMVFQPESSESEKSDTDSDFSEPEAMPRPRARAAPKPRQVKAPPAGPVQTQPDQEDVEVGLESTDDEGMRMGFAGGPITDADRRAMALNLMSFSVDAERDKLSEPEKWLQFGMRYPQRSYRAWAQSYRNHKADIDRRVRRYRKRAELRRVAAAPLPSAGTSNSTTGATLISSQSTTLGKRKAATPPEADRRNL